MGPKPSQPQSAELFRPRLDELLNLHHPLIRLAALIDWTEIERVSSEKSVIPRTVQSSVQIAKAPSAMFRGPLRPGGASRSRRESRSTRDVGGTGRRSPVRVSGCRCRLIRIGRTLRVP